MSRKLGVVLFLGAAATLIYWGCGGDSTAPEQPQPSRAVAADGDQQTGTVGQQLSSSLVVRIDDQDGNPMSDVTVQFAVTEGGGSVSRGGGSVSSLTTTTDAGGQATSDWTLGTTAGALQEVTASVSGAGNVAVTFTATAEPDVAAIISADSGDNQQAYRGTKLTEYIVVRVRDQYANGVPNQIVEFAALTVGSVDSAAAFTDATGRARTGWTLGAQVGEDTVQATVAGLTGSPVTFTATAHNLNIESVSPEPVAWGGVATITGSGFDPTPGNNVVTVGGEVAVVTAASATQLDITAPSMCWPADAYDFQVSVGTLISAPLAVDLEPASFLSLAAGEQVIVQDPSEFCLQFAETAASESYLIGVQSVSETASERTPVTVTSMVAPGAVAAPPAALLAQRQQGRALSPEAGRRMELLRRHRIAESEILAQGLELLESSRAGIPRAAAPAQVPQDVQVGDTLSIRVPTSTMSCDSYAEITTVARAVGTRAVWLDDVANPAGGYTTADFQSFDDQFENDAYDVDVAYFGVPSDIDANGRVVIVVSQEVNKLEGPAGFVSPLDFLTRAQCAASDEGEIFYVWTPDPEAVLSDDTLALEDLRYIAPTINAHEFVHIIQIGRRVQAGAPTLQRIWELEGQASLGEEVVGHAVEGHALWQNLGVDVAINFDFTAQSDWYFYTFVELFRYNGADFGVSPPVRVQNAPEDCTWEGRDTGHVCSVDLVNGVPWTFLRWLSDHFGPNFAGGEQELQRNLVDNTLAGFANIEDVVGVSMDTLLAQWAAMLYVDDRVLGDGTPAVVDSILRLRTWDLYDVVEGVVFAGVNVHRLAPRTRAFTAFSDQSNVRAGSSAYFIVSGNGRAATAIRARDADDDQLPQHMQVWVVRMK